MSRVAAARVRAQQSALPDAAGTWPIWSPDLRTQALEPAPLEPPALEAIPVESPALEPLAVEPPAPEPVPLARRPRLADVESRPVLAPFDWSAVAVNEKLIVAPKAAPTVCEEFNRLAATLRQTQLLRGCQVLMVTSAAAQEGKSLIVANIALTLTETYQRRVLIVDADVRRPSMHVIFGRPRSPGLGDHWETDAPPLQVISPRLSILSAGVGSSDQPMRTLASDRTRAFIDAARGAFDWIFIDTAPVGIVADVNVLASMSDGALVVARAGKTRSGDLQQAIDAVGRDQVVGVILNDASEIPQRYYPTL